MAQFWHTLKEDGSKYRLKFMLDRKELSLTLDDFRTIFHLPQATDNNHDSFVSPPSFYDMIPFYKNHLGFTMEIKTPSSFKTTDLLQPWQILCKIFSQCLTTRIIGWDQPHLLIMKIMYCFINNIHVDYAELLWEGIYYCLLHSTSLIPCPRFMKIIIGRYKYKVRKKISDWMISEEMKQIEHYRMYAEVFGIDVPLIQSSPTESTQGRHMTPSAPRSPTPKVDASASTRSTVIRLRLPQWKSTRLTPPAPVLTVDKADELILQDTLQVSLIEHKSRQEQEARENVALVEKHLASEEIEKMVEGQENVVDDKVGITDVIVHVNVYDEEEEEEEITNEVYELKRREKGKNVEESKITPFLTPIRSSRIHTNLELQRRYGYLFEHLRAKFMPRKSFVTLADHLHEALADPLPTMVDKHIKEQVEKQVPKQVHNQVPIYVAEGTPVVHPRDQDDPHDDAHPEWEKSVKRQKTSKYETYVFGESLFGLDNEQEQGPSTSGNQEQADDYDFWTKSYASDNDEIPTKQVSQDIIEEVSLNVDEAKLKKIADEMLRQRCTS
uniref:Uncharacterized protein n=1 Tax=Tanacetum cinerariifolium TaxID=118510 RepID=A0A6L2NFH2_TANCI|nr:hypothetical protein [Tanacetum cinerariifolium]